MSGKVIIHDRSIFILKATINFNLPPVRYYDCNVIGKCDEIACLYNWWTTRGDSARPASSTGWSERGDTLFQKVLILMFINYIGGHRLPKTSLISILIRNIGH